MTSTVIYVLVIISGSVRAEIISNPGLNQAQCHRAGEQWVVQAPNHRYACRAVTQTINSK